MARVGLAIMHGSGGLANFRYIRVNGEPGVASMYGEQLVSILSLLTDGLQVLGVYTVLNPEKLRFVALSQRTSD